MDTRITFAATVTAALAVAGHSQATYNHPPPPPPPTTGCHITADAHGHTSYNAGEFWGIDFESGCDSAFIQSVTIDLQGGSDADAYFDLSGSGSSGPSLGWLTGIDASDISFSPDSGDTSTLTLNFAAGAFGAGDYLRFGADTDHLGPDDDGGDVGRQGVTFTVTFENGSSYTTAFDKIHGTKSRAEIWADDCCDPGTGVPTPGAAAMGLLLIGGIASRRRRHNG